MKSFAIEFADTYECGYLILGVFAILLVKVRQTYFSLVLFLLVTGILRVTSIILAEQFINTIPIYHLIGVTELIVLYRLYRANGVSVVWNAFFFPILLYYIVNSFFLVGIYQMNGIAHALVQLFLFGLAVNYLFLIYSATQKKPHSIPKFFFANAGIMIYASGVFIAMVLNERSLSVLPSGFFDYAWFIESIFGVIRLLLITITIRKIAF